MNDKQKETLIVVTSVLAVLGLAFVFRRQITDFLNLPLQKYFDEKNEKALLELHPKFRSVAKRFLKEVKDKLGYEPVITDAGRTISEAQANEQAGIGVTYSYHLAPIGLAFDVNFKKDNVPILVKASSREAWRPVVDIANKHNLTWGGTFSNVGGHDFVHFDYRNLVNNRKPSELLKLPKDKNGFIKI